MAPSMARWNGKIAIVTGSTAGIGKAICENLVRNGLKVVGFARREDRNKALAKELEGEKGKFYPVTVDVTKEEDIKNGFKWVKENLGPVHILVNNAGISHKNSLIGGDIEKWRKLLDTNVLGLCICTREAIESMKENNVDGHIVHINSVAGHYPMKHGTHVYGASKYAVTALTDTLRNELTLAKSKIKVSSVSPGLVKSEIMIAAGLDKSAEVAEFLKNAPILKCEDIADAVEFVLSTPPHVQIHEMIVKPVGEMF